MNGKSSQTANVKNTALWKETSMRFCTNCQQEKKVENGVFKILKGGLNRRWKCGSCVQMEHLRDKQALERLMSVVE
jgi:hypothetical protein